MDFFPGEKTRTGWGVVYGNFRNAAVIENEGGLRTSAHEIEGERELALKNTEIEGEAERSEVTDIFAKEGGLGEFVGLGVEHAADAGQTRMGHRLEIPLEIRRLGTRRSHDGLDDAAGLLGERAKIAGLVSGFFTIDFHENSGLNPRFGGRFLIVRVVEATGERGKTFRPLVSEAIRLEKVDMSVDHEAGLDFKVSAHMRFRADVAWCSARRQFSQVR